VTFRRDDIVLGEGVKIKMGDGKKRPMTVGDIDAILDNVDRLPDGRWLAISSKFLSGKPLGPFNYIGRRKDDPNDTVNHQDRRELRGLYVLAAWLNHFDTKQHNSLDMFVSEGGRSFVKHYLIDFASTLGAGANGASARYGFEHTVDLTMMIARQFTFGFKEDRWRKRTRDHGYHEVGFLEFEYFHPARFRPLQPNHAFANTTDRDGYWAAKIVASFDDDHLGAIVAQGQYQEPGAAAYVAGVLAANRDKIARYYFDRVTPLDYFRHSEGVIHFDDLGRRYNLYEAGATRYRVRVSAVDEDRKAHKDSRTDWMEIAQLRVSLHDGPAVAVGENAPSRPYPFLALECQVDRGEGWSGSVTAYVSRASGHVVAVDR